jgi:tetratricopeptide (TPR) repeat protein
MKMKLILGLTLLVTACASTQKSTPSGKETMDVKDTNREMVSPPIKVEPSNAAASATSAFNWQSLFKGNPPSKERPLLQATIKQLSSASNVTDLMKRGRNEFAIGLFAAAESTFRQVLRKDPKNIDALIELAATLQKMRRIPAAMDVLAEAKSAFTAQERPNPAEVFRYRYTLAMTYLAADDRPKAHSILSDLIGKDRTFLPGYAALAFSYLKDGKDNIAKFIVEQALDRGGDHPSLYNIMGILAERQNKPIEAREHYNKALSMNDLFAPALVNRANLYVTSKEIAIAEVDYKKALEADPANTDAMIGLGAVLRQTGRYKSAKETFERVLDIDIDNPQARFNLALLMRENLKDEGQALRYFNEVMQSERANQSLKSVAKSAIEEIRNM